MSQRLGPALVRAIGKWALTAIVINSVVGSGVFGLLSTLAGYAGAWSPVTVLIASCGSFTILLCFAEVARAVLTKPSDRTFIPAKHSAPESDFKSGGFTSGHGFFHARRCSTY